MVLVFLIGLGMVVWFLEEERERRREGEDRFRTIAEAVYEGVSISAGGEILDANAMLGEILRADRGALIGRSMLDFVAPESRALYSRRSRRAEEPREFLGLRTDGTIFPAEARARFAELVGGDAAGVTARPRRQSARVR